MRAAARPASARGNLIIALQFSHLFANGGVLLRDALCVSALHIQHRLEPLDLLLWVGPDGSLHERRHPRQPTARYRGLGGACGHSGAGRGGRSRVECGVQSLALAQDGLQIAQRAQIKLAAAHRVIDLA